MRIDTKQELAEMIGAYGLQSFLEAVADICQDKSNEPECDDVRDWRSAARKLRDLAGAPAVEAVS